MSTLPTWWTDPYPEVSSTKTATDYLDGLGAALNRRQEDGSWVLSTGEQELITAATPEELDSFVLGFALAHVICERHGPIGQRSGPTRLPHPTEGQGQDAPAATATDTGEDTGDKTGEDTADGEDGDRNGEPDRDDDGDRTDAGADTAAGEDDGDDAKDQDD